MFEYSDRDKDMQEYGEVDMKVAESMYQAIDSFHIHWLTIHFDRRISSYSQIQMDS